MWYFVSQFYEWTKGFLLQKKKKILILSQEPSSPPLCLQRAQTTPQWWLCTVHLFCFNPLAAAAAFINWWEEQFDLLLTFSDEQRDMCVLAVCIFAVTCCCACLAERGIKLQMKATSQIFLKVLSRWSDADTNVMLSGAHGEAVKKPIISLSFQWMNKIVLIPIKYEYAFLAQKK